MAYLIGILFCGVLGETMLEMRKTPAVLAAPAQQL